MSGDVYLVCCRVADLWNPPPATRGTCAICESEVLMSRDRKSNVDDGYIVCCTLCAGALAKGCGDIRVETSESDEFRDDLKKKLYRGRL
jgi:hypothetical protein